LIKDQDIWLESSTDYHHSAKAWFVDKTNGSTFVVSNQLYSIIERIFKEQLAFECDFEHNVFKEIVANKLRFIGPLREQKSLFYTAQFTEQNNLLSEILSGNFYNTIPQIISLTFNRLFYENGMNWIECIKFKMLKGDKLDRFNFGKVGEPRTPNYHLITEFFKSDSMMRIYELATISENIKYLQKSILKIDTLQSKEATHRDKAIVRIYLEATYKDQFPKLQRSEIKPKNFEIAFSNLGYWGKTKSKDAKAIDIDDLKKIKALKLLAEYPNAENRLNEDLDDLENS